MMIRKNKASVLLLALSMPSLAWASCTRATGPIPMPWVGEVIVKQNGVIGELLRPSAPVTDNKLATLCVPNQQATFSGRWNTPAGWRLITSPNGDVMQTNLAGVGITMHISDSNITGAERRSSFDNTRTISASEGLPANGRRAIYDNSTYTISLVRTANALTFGDVSLNTFYYLYTDGQTNQFFRQLYINGLKVVAAACSVKAGDLNQTVDLGSRLVSDVIRDGYSPWVDFSITSEDCDTAQLSDARFTFTAPAAAGNAGLFEAKSAVAGRALGIGLELQAVPASGAVAVTPNARVTVPSLSNGDTYEFRARMRTLSGVRPLPGRLQTPIQVNVDFM